MLRPVVLLVLALRPLRTAAEGEAVDDGDSYDEDVSPPAAAGAAPAGTAPADVDASIDAAYARYIPCKPGGKVTKEGIRQVFERLDKEQIAKAERQKLKASHKKTDNDVSEIYSPPRITTVAESTGLRPGWALDLTVNKPDGKPWDLSIKENQVLAEKKLDDETPELLVGSPMCAAFSTLQNLNYSKMTAQEIIDKVRAAMEHIRFTLMLCEKQVEAGRLFLFDHPVQAKSWSLSLVKRLYKYKRVVAVDYDFCQSGMPVSYTHLTLPTKA